MGYAPITPSWVYDALVTEPKAEKPAVALSIRFAPLVVSIVVGLTLAAIYLSFKGVPF